MIKDIRNRILPKSRLTILLAFFLPLFAHSQETGEYESILKQIGDAPYRLWGIKEFKPNLIWVDTDKNEMKILTFQCDTIGLQSESWDHKVAQANSTTSYNGKKYITINCRAYDHHDFLDKVKLIAHESFHYYQEELGYDKVTSNNFHLDQGEGRILFRCELNALQQALSGNRNALADALRLRYYRQNTFTNNERTFELNEGLAEYTGLAYTYTNPSDIREKLLSGIKNNSQQGYSNYFAYITGPIYAFFSMQSHPDRNKGKITDVAESLLSDFHINANAVSQTETDSLKYLYGYKEIAEEENRISGLADQYRSLWEEKKYIAIPNNGVNILFNPNDRVIELNDSVVCLMNVELSAAWGRLKADNGLLRSKDWSSFFIPEPTSIQKDIIMGADYELYLKPGYQLDKGMIVPCH